MAPVKNIHTCTQGDNDLCTTGSYKITTGIDELDHEIERLSVESMKKRSGYERDQHGNDSV
jgi:hypothetical protein